MKNSVFFIILPSVVDHNDHAQFWFYNLLLKKQKKTFDVLISILNFDKYYLLSIQYTASNKVFLLL